MDLDSSVHFKLLTRISAIGDGIETLGYSPLEKSLDNWIRLLGAQALQNVEGWVEYLTY
jgi:hypothetical protein